MKDIDLTVRGEESQRERLRPAAMVLKDGRLVILPTTTYYGLAADALNPSALRRVYAAKRRDPSKPIIALVDSLEMMRSLVVSVPDEVKDLDWRFGSRGLSFILRASPQLPPELTGGTGTVGVRIERHEVVQDILELVGQPITGTSANMEGRPPPVTADAAVAGIGSWADAVVRWWPSQATAASTIVDVTGEVPSVIREGTVPTSEITDALAGRPSGG
jgi:L-threonylcarbamoyladenylate synthase